MKKYFLNLKDFKIIAEACIVYLFDQDKLERLNKLNHSLVQVENCKDIAKWLLKNVSFALKSQIDETKIFKFFHSTLGLIETKAQLLKELVKILSNL